MAKSAATFQSLLQDEYRISPDAAAQRLAAFDEFTKQVASRMPGEGEEAVDQGRSTDDGDGDGDEAVIDAKAMDCEEAPSGQWRFDAAIEMQAAQDLTVHRLKVRHRASQVVGYDLAFKLCDIHSSWTMKIDCQSACFSIKNDKSPL